MKRIIHIISTSLLLCFLLINVLSIYNISFLGFRVFKVGSGSMTPFLKVGDVIAIKESNSYSKGDVVTYEKNGEYITHRIISIDGDVFTAQGDANNTADEPAFMSKIVGKLIFKSSLLGFISSLVIKPFFIGLVSIILIVYLFLSKERTS